MTETETTRRKAIEDRIAAVCGIIRRPVWGATPPVRPLDPDWDYNAIVVHYTGHGSYADMAAVQRFDVDHRHWDDVAYHYGVKPSGEIYEGRELIYKGSHTLNQNSGKVGIVCFGDFDNSVANFFDLKPYSGDKIDPTMLASLRRLSLQIMANFNIVTFGGHKEYGVSETCPGENLLPLVQKMRAELKLAAPVFRKF